MAEAHVRRRLGAVHRRLSDYPQALAHGRHSIAVFRAAGDLGCEAEALKDVGLVHQRQGRYDAAIRHQRRVQQLAVGSATA